MTPERDVATLLRQHFDTIPVAQGPTTAELRARAAVSGRPARRWPLLAAAVAVLAVAVVPGLLDRGPGGVTGAGVDRGATLPRELPGLSLLTAKVSQSPPGRAIAVFRQGAWGTRWGTTQVVVLGADGRTYRRLDVAEERGHRAADSEWSAAPTLLAPDGLSVAVADPTRVTSTIDVVDLTTGESRPYALDPPAAARPLAWSPAGRSLIYAVLDGPSEDGYGPARLAMLDIDTGRSRPVGALLADGATAAVITADNRSLVVAGDGPACRMRLLDLTGAELPRDLPAGDGCGGHLARADDTDPGRIVVEEQADNGAKTARFLDVVDPDAGVPGPVDIGAESWLVGWRPGGVLVTTPEGLVEVSTDGTPPQVLTRFSETGTSAVYDWQVAANLVPGAVADGTGVDRGPWPWWWRISLTVVLVLILLIVYRGRSRRATPAAPGSLPGESAL